MKKGILIFTLCFCVMSADSYGIIFSDDFESGTLHEWIIGGRQEGRESVAEVVSYHGSQQAHLYQDGFTEINMSKSFNYQNDLHFSFDMETQVFSEANDPEGYHRVTSGVAFAFQDSSFNQLGDVRYLNATSIYSILTQNPKPEIEIFEIDSGFANYSMNIEDILSNITINENVIAYVSMRFGIYVSSDQYNMSGHNWVDNVVVTPEPTSALLLIVGAGLFRYGKRKR